MTYFRRDRPDYHRRWRVSRSCSRWEGVVPRRYGRQTKRWPGGVAVRQRVSRHGSGRSKERPGSGRGGRSWALGGIAPDTVGAMRTVIGSSCTGN